MGKLFEEVTALEVQVPKARAKDIKVCRVLHLTPLDTEFAKLLGSWSLCVEVGIC